MTRILKQEERRIRIFWLTRLSENEIIFLELFLHVMYVINSLDYVIKAWFSQALKILSVLSICAFLGLALDKRIIFDISDAKVDLDIWFERGYAFLFFDWVSFHLYLWFLDIFNYWLSERVD